MLHYIVLTITDIIAAEIQILYASYIGVHGNDISITKSASGLSFPFDRVQDIVAVHQSSAGRVHVYGVYDQHNNRSFRFRTSQHRTDINVQHAVRPGHWFQLIFYV